MSNVIALPVPNRRAPQPRILNRLARGFASERRGPNDVFWLKENAEFLNVTESTGQAGDSVIAAYETFYAEIMERIAFFPQYYRFFLSICFDFEDLKGRGSTGIELANWVAQAGLPCGELSDLQRLEARRLLARRGVRMPELGAELEARVRDFMGRSSQFALPNKKIAYELTHAVFYLTEYGRKSVSFEDAVLTSLEFVGLWAFIEMNADLLAEVCVAMRFAGRRPPEIWEGWIARHLRNFSFAPSGAATPAGDDYHEFLMCQWSLMCTQDVPRFEAAPPVGISPVFRRPEVSVAPLREMSECLFRLQGNRSGRWSIMRPVLTAMMSPEAQTHLVDAEASSARFSEFFELFARVGFLERAAS
ncbi:DUF6902 family protein [Shimia haliotis]|uniref:Uncharacterized protein n=1 Tax=Shimia haliotis TaxID=1280847 RepID=A0A1I4ALN6_9RHOB|nr:hypothetical protein [Shimia haliotis]SFK57183.1 hypothetical protein SAMN04488036_101454 [Shimia haliotis]